jgi:hypothetical protein
MKMSIENFGLNSPVRAIIEHCSDKEDIKWNGVLPYYKGEKLFPVVTEEDEGLLKKLFSIKSFVGTYKKDITTLFTKEETKRIRELDKYLDIPKAEYVCNTDYLTMCNNFFKRGERPEKKFSRINRVKYLKIIKMGYLDVLKWVRENGRPWDDHTCVYAAYGGHLDMLKWVRENGCPWDKDTCIAAAEKGQFELLKWARTNGCPWDEETCHRAAEHGHLEILKWARENGCPWNEYTCNYAARKGQLCTLKWAIENGCPWDEEICKYAAEYGHLNILNWMRENGYSRNETCG